MKLQQYINQGVKTILNSLFFTCKYPTNKVSGKLGLFNPIIAFCYVDFALLHSKFYKYSLMPLLETNPL